MNTYTATPEPTYTGSGIEELSSGKVYNNDWNEGGSDGGGAWPEVNCNGPFTITHVCAVNARWIPLAEVGHGGGLGSHIPCIHVTCAYFRDVQSLLDIIAVLFYDSSHFSFYCASHYISIMRLLLRIHDKRLMIVVVV